MGWDGIGREKVEKKNKKRSFNLLFHPFTVPIHPPFFAPSLLRPLPSTLSLEVVGLRGRSKERFDGGSLSGKKEHCIE